MQGVTLKLTSAIALDGKIFRPGTLVEVTDNEAKNLLQRGKAVLATEADMPADESDESDAAAEAAEREAAEKAAAEKAAAGKSRK
jgi:ribosomal protein L9